MVVEIAEKVPMSWRKRPPPCGDTDMQFVMEVEERLLGSCGEVIGQCMWDRHGHAIGDEKCGEVIGQCVCGGRQGHAVGDGS